nr:NAD(P)H-dependent oxidoreductase [uncultured Clostridium sp.]
MNVLVILGSPRKKDSYLICMEIGNELKKYDSAIDFEYLQLSESYIEECKGCGICFQKSELLCPCREDEIGMIKEKMKKADAVIISSPVYAYQVTGQMKKFIDRLSYLFHRQELCGKPVLLVITTDGGGSKQVYKYLKMTVSGWAMDLVGDIQIISPMYFENREPKGVFKYNKRTFEKGQKKIKDLSKKLYEKMSQRNKKTLTYYDIFLFNCLRSKIYTSDADRIYWKEKGWIDAPYFYDVDLNPVKRIFGKIMKRLIDILGKKISSGS